MSPGVLTLLLCLGAFLLGSIPFGLIVARLRGVDIRAAGSGNIGMTNVWRVLGWPAGVTVLVLDILKGFVPALLAAHTITAQQWLTTWTDGTRGREWLVYGPHWNRFDIERAHWFWETTELNIWLATYIGILVGFSAVLGHTFTPWLRFRGGKGVATGLGVAIALYGGWILIPVAVFLLALFATRMVSVGSILAAVALAGLSLVVPFTAHLWPFGVLAALLVVYTHRANIRRILAGTENKVSFARRSAAPSASSASASDTAANG